MSEMPTLTCSSSIPRPSTDICCLATRLGEPRHYYIPPSGTEEALFGNGITLKVTMTWDGSVAKLYLNDTLVQQSSVRHAHAQLERGFQF